MADMQIALRNRLIAGTPLAAERIYWNIVPQNTARPYVRMQIISDERPEHLAGYDDARQTRVQADCFADKYAAATALAEQVIEAVAQPTDIDGIAFGRTKAVGPRDLGEDTAEGYIHRMSLDLLVWHRLA